MDTPPSLRVPSLVSLLVMYWLPVSATIIAVCLIYNKFQKGLNGIPGPAAASWTALWRLFEVQKGHFHQEQIRLHQKHGKLVRIAPHVISVADPDAIPIIYSLKHNFTKTAFYPIQSILWEKKVETNVFSTRDPALHRDQRRQISSSYSMTNLLQCERSVDICTELFASKLSDYADGRKPIDLGEWLQYYAFDVVGELTFGKKLGFLEGGEDVDGMINSIHMMLPYSAVIGQVPTIHYFLLGNPILGQLMPAMEKWNQVIAFTLKAMNSRTKPKPEEGADNAEEKGADMLSKWLEMKTTDPYKLSKKDLVVHLSANVFAGSDTTSITLRSVVYNLYRNPLKMKKVIEEIDKADREGNLSTPITCKESDTHLPYFEAVLKEAMRLHPPIGLMLERHVPSEGIELCGKFIAGGTIVGINPWVLNYDPETFNDPETFIPERWLANDEGAKKREAIIGFIFGAGARVCIGKNISIMEMHKILPELYRRYTIELAHPEQEWKVSNYWFVQQTELICNLTKRK